MMPWLRAPMLPYDAWYKSRSMGHVTADVQQGKKQSHRMRVLAAHADSLFRAGAGIESARTHKKYPIPSVDGTITRYLAQVVRILLSGDHVCSVCRKFAQATAVPQRSCKTKHVLVAGVHSNN